MVPNIITLSEFCKSMSVSS